MPNRKRFFKRLLALTVFASAFLYLCLGAGTGAGEHTAGTRLDITLR